MAVSVQHFESGVPARRRRARGPGGVEEAAQDVAARHGQAEHHGRKGETRPAVARDYSQRPCVTRLTTSARP